MSRHRRSAPEGEGKKERVPLKPATADEACIRVRLNAKTVVLLKSMNSFASWKERYPDAVVIEEVTDKAKG